MSNHGCLTVVFVFILYFEQQRQRAHGLMLTFASTLNGALASLVQGLTESNGHGTSTAGSDYVDGGSDADVEGSSSEEEEETETDVGPAANKNAEPSRPLGLDIESSRSQENEETDTDVDPVAEKDAEASHPSGIDVEACRSQEDEETETDAEPAANKDAEPSRPTGPDVEINVVLPSSNAETMSGSSSMSSPPAMHSQIFIPSDTEMYGLTGVGRLAGMYPILQVIAANKLMNRSEGLQLTLQRISAL